MSEAGRDGKDGRDGKTWYEEFTVSGSELLDQVKGLVHEGNVRRVFIKNSDGRTLLEIPLTAGVAVTAVTAVIAPALVAVGAVAALLTQATVGVERRAEPGAEPSSGTGPDAELPGQIGSSQD
ncbi:DUF4342 domain-containing protein [Georgenia alba]|uniref:DUF4342 domain-containing protein n=1 Tax=Georgenia alba TaxID=2233858 RepID=A0ABW2QDD7_9MICO